MLNTGQFEGHYLNLYLNDETMWSDEVFAILQILFGNVDAYTDDDSLRNEFDIAQGQLLESKLESK